MTTYNTGNPIGSKDPRDLYDNAENLDQAVNTKSKTWRDRFGVLRPSLAGATDPAGAIQDAITVALNAAAISGSTTYRTTALGIAGTDNGDMFWVFPNNDNDLENLVLYQNSNGTAVELYEQYNLNQFMITEGDIWE